MILKCDRMDCVYSKKGKCTAGHVELFEVGGCSNVTLTCDTFEQKELTEREMASISFYRAVRKQHKPRKVTNGDR